MRQICKIWNTTFLRCRSTISTNTKATNSFYKVARAKETWLSSFGVFCTLTALHVSPNLKSGHQNPHILKFFKKTRHFWTKILFSPYQTESDWWTFFFEKKIFVIKKYFSSNFFLEERYDLVLLILRFLCPSVQKCGFRVDLSEKTPDFCRNQGLYNRGFIYRIPL